MKIKPYFPYRFAATCATIILAWFVYSAWVVAAPFLHIQFWPTPVTLPQALASHGAVIEKATNGKTYLYVIGGKNANDDPIGNVMSFEVNSTGVITTSKLDLAALPVPLYLHAVAATDQYIYVVGGWDGDQWHAEVWYTKMIGNGDINGWKKTSYAYREKIALHDSAIATINNEHYLYVLGGENENQKILDKVGYAHIHDDTGDIDDWNWADYKLKVPLDRLAVAVNQNAIYITGGYDGKHAQSSVYYATVGNDGNLTGDWALGPNLLNARYYHKAIIANDKLYVLGGRDDNNELSTIDITSLSVDQPGQWETEYSLVESLSRFATVKAGDKPNESIYILGGLHNNEYRNLIYRYIKPQIQGVSLTNSRVSDESGTNDTLTYNLTLVNGPVPLTDILINNPIPVGASSIFTQPLDSDITIAHLGTGPGDYLSWHLNTLTSGATKTISYQISVSPGMPSLNGGMTITWHYQGYTGETHSNAVSDPAYYFPLIQK